jgi:hypothetical protein
MLVAASGERGRSPWWLRPLSVPHRTPRHVCGLLADGLMTVALSPDQRLRCRLWVVCLVQPWMTSRWAWWIVLPFWPM